MVLNINENVLKGQIQSYLSNPESMLKLPPTESSSFKKLEMKIGEKQDIWSKYVNTEENRIDEHSIDYDDVESGKKAPESQEKIPNESPKVHHVRNRSMSDEIRRKAILNQAKKSGLDLQEEMKKGEEHNKFSIKISKI